MNRTYHPSIEQCDERANSQNITQGFSPPQGMAQRDWQGVRDERDGRNEWEI